MVSRSTFDDYFLERSLPVTRAATLLGLLLIWLFAVLDPWALPVSHVEAWWVRFGFITPPGLLLFALTWTRFYRRHSQTILALGTLPFGLGVLLLLFVSDRGEPAHDFYAYGLVLYVLNVLILSRLRTRAALPSALLVVGAYLYLEIAHRGVFADAMRLPTFINFLFILFSALLVAIFSNIYLEYFMRRDYLAGREILREKTRNEKLLHSILPPTIARRLGDAKGIVADDHDGATCLFADLSGFTAFAAKMNASEVVTLLNELFSRFDELTENRGVEKIKTIGDAYMAVAGVPEPREDHAPVMAELALDFLRTTRAFAKARNVDLGIRIGLSSGPVTAGVIGKRKFAYDVWGDTVNTASRMESSARRDSIQVSRSTYELLRDEYEFDTRTDVLIKGKGAMDIHVLKVNRREPRNSQERNPRRSESVEMRLSIPR